MQPCAHVHATPRTPVQTHDLWISADREGGEASVQAETVTYLDSRHIPPAKYTAARLKSTYRAAFVQARLPLAWDGLESSGRTGDVEKQTHTLAHTQSRGKVEL